MYNLLKFTHSDHVMEKSELRANVRGALGKVNSKAWCVFHKR